MSEVSPDVESLIRRASGGDATARDALFGQHRLRLKRMVRVRLHPRISRRIDESDVIQEALLDAAQRLHEFCPDGPIPFFLWLRQIAVHKLLDLHRRHLGAARRDVRREVPLDCGLLPTATSASLAAQLLTGLTSPSSAAARAETRHMVRKALDGLESIDREILALRHFERLSNAEAALVLSISETACSNRYVRALKRLKQILQQIPGLS